jgi:hypothetical protein
MATAKYRTICFPLTKRLLKIVLAVLSMVPQTSHNELVDSAWMELLTKRFTSYVFVSSMKLSLWRKCQEFGGRGRKLHAQDQS